MEAGGRREDEEVEGKATVVAVAAGVAIREVGGRVGNCIEQMVCKLLSKGDAAEVASDSSPSPNDPRERSGPPD
jgi:hypothetical protein